MKLIVLLIATLILACAPQQGNERLAEKARIEGEESAKKQTEAENKNRSTRASEMEVDLAKRHRFYQAMKGIYEGPLQTDVGAYRIRITLSPSLPPYPSTGRVRDLGEIEEDLSNLFLNVHIVQWDPVDDLGVYGCRIQGVKPDLNTGEIYISSVECPNSYILYMSQPSPKNSDPASVSQKMASEVVEGKLKSVSRVTGQMRLTNRAAVYQFSAQRVQRGKK